MSRSSEIDQLPSDFFGSRSSSERQTRIVRRPKKGIFQRRSTLWFLFVLTIISTTWSGTAVWSPVQLLFTAATEGSFHVVRRMILANCSIGLQFSLSLIGILLAHELGHYFMARYYRIPATPPIFIPFPVQPFGTMGAVIAMDGGRADKKEIFDIGIAGPLAGLLVAIPVLIIGLKSSYQPNFSLSPAFQFGQPLLIRLLAYFVQSDWLANGAGITNTSMNPFLMAGWTGLFITGLNMMPMGQLDGGHVIFGLFGKKAIHVARATFVICAFLIIYLNQWIYIVMLLLVFFLLGLHHPPSRNDNVDIGLPRRILGFASLTLPVLCIPASALVDLSNQ